MDKIQISLEQLARLTGKTPDELGNSLFVENEGEKVPTDDAEERLSQMFSGKFKAVGDDFHKKGFKDAWGQVGEFVSQDQDFDPKGAQGRDLLDAYVKFRSEKAAKSAGNFSKEDLENNELVKAFVNERTQSAKQKLEEYKKQLEEEKTAFYGQTKRTIARTKLLESLPVGILGDDQKERDRRLGVLFELLDNRLNYIDLEEGAPKLIDPSTKEPLTDGELNPVRFSDWVQGFNPFPPIQSGGVQRSPGAKTSQPGISGEVRVISKDDYLKQLSKASNASERSAINTAYADYLEKNGK